MHLYEMLPIIVIQTRQSNSGNNTFLMAIETISGRSEQVKKEALWDTYG